MCQSKEEGIHKDCIILSILFYFSSTSLGALKIFLQINFGLKIILILKTQVNDYEMGKLILPII